MAIIGHRIEKKLSIQEFSELMGNYSSESIICTEHTFFRLSERQRKLFKCTELKSYLLEKRPILAGIQYNGNYAVFYSHGNDEIIKIILDVSVHKIEIVTFYTLNKQQIPMLK